MRAGQPARWPAGPRAMRAWPVRWSIRPVRWPRVGSACVDIRPFPKTDVLIFSFFALTLLPTPTAVAWVGCSASFMCLYVCTFVFLPHNVSKSDANIRSPYLTYTWSIISLGKTVFGGLKVKGQGHEAHRALPACECC